jgi:hypothetical protein
MKNTNSMSKTVSSAIADAVKEKLDHDLFAIQYNLSSVFRGLLYTAMLENEKKEGGVGDIDNLVRIIMQSSHYEGPDGEEYPTYDEASVHPIITRLTNTMQENGIQQAWNLGANKAMYPKSKSDELADALAKVLGSLENWMEIADKEDVREYDQEAVVAAKKALARVGRELDKYLDIS